MDYNRIVQEILNIGEELLKSGAEIFRVEDSLYRMCRSYGFVRSDVYASNDGGDARRRDYHTDPLY